MRLHGGESREAYREHRTYDKEIKSIVEHKMQKKWFLIISVKKKNIFTFIILTSGAKGEWDFRISDLVKNPDETDI